MRCLALLCCVAATTLGAQQPPPPRDSAPPESLRPPPPESLRPPLPPPSPEQRRFLSGLRTATRGIAQLNNGLNRVQRAQATGDSDSQRTAGRFLAGLCGSGRVFMRRGRPLMNPAVYSDSIRLTARRLVAQLDTLIAYAPNCEQGAAATPVPIAADLGKRMKTYDTALRDFRLAIGLPVKDDTVKAAKR